MSFELEALLREAAAPVAAAIGAKTEDVVFVENATTGLNAVLRSLDFKPGVHLNYQESALPIKDGLPKMKDFPKEFGGSGETLAE